jgi:hypothetical protein
MNRAHRKLAGWIGAVLVLGAVFLGYTNPQLMVDLANRLWACF